jgi:hypothetical protein
MTSMQQVHHYGGHARLFPGATASWTAAMRSYRVVYTTGHVACACSGVVTLPIMAGMLFPFVRGDGLVGYLPLL